jgi:hypothetical protein
VTISLPYIQPESQYEHYCGRLMDARMPAVYDTFKLNSIHERLCR